MSDETNPQKRTSTKAEVKEDKHVQHLHRVFGRYDHERNSSQKHVVNWLRMTERMPTFRPSKFDGKIDPLAAAKLEGQRELAGAILAELERDPVTQTQKPIVTK